MYNILFEDQINESIFQNIEWLLVIVPPGSAMPMLRYNGPDD